MELKHTPWILWSLGLVRAVPGRPTVRFKGNRLGQESLDPEGPLYILKGAYFSENKIASSRLSVLVQKSPGIGSLNVVVAQSLSLFVAPWTAAPQASLSFTISQSLLKLMSIETVMPSNHLILCHPLLLLPSIFPNIRVFSNEPALPIRWPEY